MKKRITLEEDEIITLAHIMDHFLDYMFGDDRPDHGFGILKQYRDLDIDKKSSVSVAGCKLIRYSKKIRVQRATQWQEEYNEQIEKNNES